MGKNQGGGRDASLVVTRAKARADTPPLLWPVSLCVSVPGLGGGGVGVQL